MKNLKRLREERGLSQKKLAEYMGVSQQSIHKYENALAEPDFKTLKSLAAFFHTTIDYLLDFSLNDSEPTPLQLPDADPMISPIEVHHLVLYRKATPVVKQSIDVLLEELKH